jgi:hypothetical protein
LVSVHRTEFRGFYCFWRTEEVRVAGKLGKAAEVEVMMRKVMSLAVICGLAAPTMAAAQDQVEKTVVEETTTTVEGGVVTTTTTELEEVEAVEEEEVETIPVVVEPLPTTAVEPALDAEAPAMVGDKLEYVPRAAHHEHPALEGLDWQLMSSAFYNFNGYRVPGDYNTLGAPYTNYMGFGLNFAGGDVSYTGEKFGVVLGLRFGTASPQLTPLPYVKQAYASWYPSEKLFLDVGWFDTIYGAEVADEWENANYTRGYLYFLRQPFNHMGARFGINGDTVGFTGMLTNGGVLGGTTVDYKEVPTAGWQVSFAPGDAFGLYVGGQHGANGFNGNRDWEHFFDVVMSVSAGDVFTMLLNTDFQIDPNAPQETGGTDTSFLQGYSLAFIFGFTDHFNMGLRGEFLDGNNKSSSPDNLWTGTLTFRYLPVEYLVLSLEGRVEGSQGDIYYTRDTVFDTDGNYISGNEDFYGQVTVGASVHFGN